MHKVADRITEAVEVPFVHIADTSRTSTSAGCATSTV
jgi:aspartate/glutamate racemase